MIMITVKIINYLLIPSGFEMKNLTGLMLKKVNVQYSEDER